ncbi:MAG TPA: sensor histidine kinase [Dyella sp.]|uniref:ATP-binding protein n=1 Tax=Dyella sp. TaxID=1869338 RepID=UPI002CA57105|nr:sensor histidine kinase [Dyella sp.]HUB90018.1 sensor histidine kinase [Dyella sp.]
MLERVIDNLISNAIKYNDADGKIEITVYDMPNGSGLRIRDHGPGVREEEKSLLFRPLFRGANAHMASGNGPWLSVVRRIMSIHGGDVFLRNTSSHGLELTLVFSDAACPDRMRG